MLDASHVPRAFPGRHSNDVSVLFVSLARWARVVRELPMLAAKFVAMRSPHIA